MLNSACDLETPENSWFFYALFFVSGFPALIYQIVWQRALFTLYGVNIESVTMIVTVFMLGLGLGSLAGGFLSRRRGIRLLLVFGSIELLIGAFGSVSLWVFHRVGSYTAGASTATTGLVALGLLLFPTLLMGSTLPLLVEYFVRRNGNVGESVGLLYSVNTLGSGVACLAAAFFLMRFFGEAGSLRFAACLNSFVGITALVLQRRDVVPVGQAQELSPSVRQSTIPLWVGMLLAGGTGFVALAYEIIWYRLYAFTTGGTARCFAELLGYYLFGVAYGSLAVRDACRKKLKHDVHGTLRVGSEVVMLGAIAAFLVGPLLARCSVYVLYQPTFVFVFIAAALMGSAFPLLSHAAIDPSQGTGRRVSLLYLSNIIGSALGSYVVGFIVLDHFSTRVTSILLLAVGVIVASTLAVLAGRQVSKLVLVAGCAVCAVLALSSKPLFSGMYERLLTKNGYKSGEVFTNLVENRSGVIAVDPNATVFGGGIYDGRFNTDLVHDSNLLVRAFAIAGFNRRPREVLMIGLSSGSWAQVIANNPDVENVTIVEINPGYVPLIRQYANVANLLRNPKVNIITDDGRRWLVSHPDRKFDLILMNTTFNWRANVTNLLSTEFLALCRAHMKSGGVAYYNTTWSDDVQYTGATAFPYALRFVNFLAVSDRPLRLDKEQWSRALAEYRIDGRPVFDLADPAQRQRYEDILHMADGWDAPNGSLESRESLIRRLRGARVITDDNMGTEWR